MASTWSTGPIMPRSLGVNPLLTITALAERAMLHLARDRGLAFDAAPRTYATPISQWRRAPDRRWSQDTVSVDLRNLCAAAAGAT